MRNATASLAEEMIRKHEGRANEPLQAPSGTEGYFDDPPYCMYAADFCGFHVSILAENPASQ